MSWVLTCALEGQLAHVTSQLPHAHGLGVSLDVGDRIPAARPVTGDEIRVGGLDLHHACRIALQACGGKGGRAEVSPDLPCREDPALTGSDKITTAALLTDDKTESTGNYKEQIKSCMILYPQSYHHHFKGHLFFFFSKVHDNPLHTYQYRVPGTSQGPQMQQ